MRQIAWMSHLKNDPLCVKSDVKLSSLVLYDTLYYNSISKWNCE